MTTTSAISVLGLCGSLRKKSLNRSLLHAAIELAPEGMTIETLELGPLPMYNQDLVDGTTYPQVVQELRERIAAADALLICSPEYNYSVSPVIKNALDWASRPPSPPLSAKPVALMGASMGTAGTARAQMALRQVFVFTNMLALNKPEVLVAKAHEKFDAEGKLTDADTRKLVGEQLVALAKWTRTLRGH